MFHKLCIGVTLQEQNGEAKNQPAPLYWDHNSNFVDVGQANHCDSDIVSAGRWFDFLSLSALASALLWTSLVIHLLIVITACSASTCYICLVCVVGDYRTLCRYAVYFL